MAATQRDEPQIRPPGGSGPTPSLIEPVSERSAELRSQELGAGSRASMLMNSIGMIAGRSASMALGFLFWLFAARFFPPDKVGLTAGVVSAMMLCTQLALLGVGSAFIAYFPRHQHTPSALLDTSISLVTVASLIMGGLFLVLASTAFRHLRVVGASRLYVSAFLAMCVLGTINVLLDQVSIAVGRGMQVLTRNVLFGVITIVCLAALRSARPAAGSLALFSLWVLAGIGACSLGAVQVWRTFRHRYRPRLQRRMAGELVRVGLPNHALTLTERAPGLILPIIVTELLSPAQNAFWYAAWMMAWVVYIIPISMGMSLFAEASHRPESLGEATRSGARASLTLGGVAALGLAVLAGFFLTLLGRQYAHAGVLPLRILVLAFLPLTFVQVYFAVCRATGRLAEAILTGTVSGLGAVAAASLAARPFGLAGMAWAWVGTQFATGVWGLLRLRAIQSGRVVAQ